MGSIKINKGIRDFAKDVGLHINTVARCLAQGMTMDQIREKSVNLAGRAAGYRRDQKVQKERVAARGYVPARRRLALSKSAEVVSGLVKKTAQKTAKDAGVIVEPEPTVEPQNETYTQAELRLKIAQANEREQIVGQRRGLLTPTVQVNQWFGECIVRARDIFTRIGPELRDKLSACDDPVECEKMIVEEVNRALAAMKLIATGQAAVEDEGEEAA